MNPGRLGERDRIMRMLDAIDASREYVLAEFYLVESGRIADQFIAAFTRAASRGVRVRVLFDWFGARGLNEALADKVMAMLLRASEQSLTLRSANEISHTWMVPLWRLIARAILAWSLRAVSRLRR